MTEFEDFLGLPAVQTPRNDIVQKQHQSGQVSVYEQNEIDEAYKETSGKLDELYEQGAQAIQSLSAMAAASDDPKAFTALAKLIGVTADIAQKRMESLQKKRQMLNNEPTLPDGTGIVNNQRIDKAIFVGSTKELLDTINNGKS